MSWKDRATVVDPVTPDASTLPDASPATGSWKDRAQVVEAPPEPKSLKGLAKNAVSDVADTVIGAGAVVKKAAYDLPKAVTESLAQTVADKVTGKDSGQTPIGKEVSDFGNNAPAMAKELVRPVVHPVDYAYEHPVNQLLNLGALAGGVASLARKAAPAVADMAETASNAMGRRAGGFTKALIKGQNFDKANDAVQWMINKKVMTPGADVETMLERVQSAKDEAWANMKRTMEEQNAGATGALKPKAAPQLREQFLFDPKKAIDDLEGLRPRSKNGTVLTGGEYDTQNGAVDNAIATIKGHGERPIPWDEANDLKGNLKANFDTTKSPATNDLKKRIHGVFNDNMEAQMENAAQARGGDISAFKEAKRDYGAAKTAEKALDNLRSSKAGNRQIGLTDTIAGAGGAAAHGAVGAGAVILAKKLIERYGPATGATLAQKLSVIASKAPALLGPYAPAIQKALMAGGSELAFTHGVLAKSDPGYRAFVNALSRE